MATKIPKNFGWGQDHVSTYREVNLKGILFQIVDDLADVKAIFNAHKHSFDGTQAADSVSGTPVAGATTGSAVGGTATSITIGLEKET